METMIPPSELATDESLDVLAGLVLEDGARWGEKAAPFQWEDARRVLDMSGPPYSFITRARGGSKTVDLAGMVLAAMLTQLGPSSNAYAVASDRDQARLLSDAAEGFIRRTPTLRGAFDLGQWRLATKRTAVSLEVLAADAPGAWGLRPSFIVADELAAWGDSASPRALWEAISSSLGKVPGARLAVITTAGSPGHWAYTVLEHARQHPLWQVSEMQGPPPWMDQERLEEQRKRLPESSYRRLFLNQWTAPEDTLTSADALRDCVAHSGPLDYVPGKTYLLSLDVGLKSDRSVACVAHLEPAEGAEGHRVVLDRMQVWAGSRANPVQLSTLEEWLVMAWRTYGKPALVLDPWQGVGLAQRLRRRGMGVHEFNFSASSVGKIAVTLHTLIRDRRVALPDDDELIDELLNVRLRESSPGVLRLDHVSGRHDDRAVALGLAAHWLMENATHERPQIRVLSSLDGAPRKRRGRSRFAPRESPGFSWQ